MTYKYMTLDEIKELSGVKQGAVMVMGERRWSAKRAEIVHNNLGATPPEKKKAEDNGFFRVQYSEKLDLTDACRLFIFKDDWQLSCIFDSKQGKYLVYENRSGNQNKEYITVKSEIKRFAYADRLGVIGLLPEKEKLTLNKEDATWRIMS